MAEQNLNASMPQPSIEAFKGINRRLSIHDEKLDKLTDIAITLSRIEERTSNQHDLQVRQVKRQDDLEERLESMEQTLSEIKGGGKVAKTVYVGLVALVSVVITWFSTGTPPSH